MVIQSEAWHLFMRKCWSMRTWDAPKNIKTLWTVKKNRFFLLKRWKKLDVFEMYCWMLLFEKGEGWAIATYTGKKTI